MDTDGKTALHWTATNGDAASVTAILDGYPSLLNKKLVGQHKASRHNYYL